MGTVTDSIPITNADEDPPTRTRKRTRTNALVRSASALVLCCGAAVMYGDILGISNVPSGTRASRSRIGERKNEYRRLVDSDSSASYDSLHSTAGGYTAPMNYHMMPEPSVSDVIITEDGTVTTYDLWLPEDSDDNTGLLEGTPRPLVIMQTKPNNWMFGHDMSCCETIRSYLDQGIAVASVVNSTSTDLDGHHTMAMELMKSKAEQYGFDPNRITVHVDSANAQRSVLEQGLHAMMHLVAVPPTYENVPYAGDGSRGERTMDFWKAEPIDEKDTGRRPVVLYIHGGGWLSCKLCGAAVFLLCVCVCVLLFYLAESNIHFVSFFNYIFR